jgi:NADPH:quinone reductase-like Zn-dependent oxidoreductase
MKAVMYTEYGPAENLRIVEIDKPVPKDNEVLVKVHATTVNRTDCGFRKPEYFIIRFFNGFFRPRKQILGNEFSGVVEEAGKKVTLFRKGDAVFGLSGMRFGAHAEYLRIAERKSIAMKPANMTHEEAAAVCDGLILAKNYLKKIDFSRRKRILINGASGSIGSAAVQLARYYGARISAVCDTKNIDLMKSLGARKVIDYTKEDFTRDDQEYDAVLDAVGKSSFFKCRRLLKPEGIYFSTELGFLSQNVFLALLSPLSFGRKVKFPIPFDRKNDIEFFKRIIENGHYRAVIDRQYTLEQIVDATRYVETGQKTGNVVIKIL